MNTVIENAICHGMFDKDVDSKDFRQFNKDCDVKENKNFPGLLHSKK